MFCYKVVRVGKVTFLGGGAGSQQLCQPELALAPATRGIQGAKALGPPSNNTRRDPLRKLRGRRIISNSSMQSPSTSSVSASATTASSSTSTRAPLLPLRPAHMLPLRVPMFVLVDIHAPRAQRSRGPPTTTTRMRRTRRMRRRRRRRRRQGRRRGGCGGGGSG